MHGVINVLKHPGLTSHDVVAKLRKLLNTKKVGHTGTLDPDALGVLPICVGKATKLVEFLTSSQKTYRAVLNFGLETTTQDSSGEIIKETALPNITEQEFRKSLDNFIGEIEQVPPIYSAIKKNGVPLYKFARRGEQIEIEPRKVIIHSINLLNFNRKAALIEITCSKGTYIRTLCQDIGRALNSSAYMSFLLRTQAGNFHISQAYTLSEISKCDMVQQSFLISLSNSLQNWPYIYIDNTKIIKALENGNKIPLNNLIVKDTDKSVVYKAIDEQNNLLAIGKADNGYFIPQKVFR